MIYLYETIVTLVIAEIASRLQVHIQKVKRENFDLPMYRFCNITAIAVLVINFTNLLREIR